MSTLNHCSVCLVVTTANGAKHVTNHTPWSKATGSHPNWGGKARSSLREGERSLHQCRVLLILFDLFFLDSPQRSVASGFIISDCFLNMLLLFLPLVHLAVRELWFISPLQMGLAGICQRRVNSQGKNNVENQIARNMCSWWEHHEGRACLGFIEHTQLFPFPSNSLKSECWQPRRESCDLTYYCTSYYMGFTIIQPFAKASCSNTILLCNLKRESSAFWALEVGKD